MNFKVPNAPLSDQQSQQLNALLGELEGWQVDWLSGYLSGWRAGQGAAPAVTASTEAAVKLTILYGSQTGNAEGVAELLAEKAKAEGVEANVVDMSDYKPRQLKNETHLAVITSTHGEGDPPDNALDMYEFLHSKKAPGLKQLKYSVLSLGDSSYEYFCQTGKDFDARLGELGGTAVVSRSDCDVDYDDIAEQWINDLVSKLKAECTAFAEHFDAKPAFVFSATGHAFGDLILNNPHTRPDAEFWTKPNSTRGNTSWIRQRVKGKENMNKLRELRAEYEKLKPECTDVSLDELYNTIGISWGDVVFSGIEWFALKVMSIFPPH
jgi:sulfite reductase alpha subunit-like flavoprotein